MTSAIGRRRDRGVGAFRRVAAIAAPVLSVSEASLTHQYAACTVRVERRNLNGHNDCAYQINRTRHD